MASASSYSTKAGQRWRARWFDASRDPRERGGFERKRDALEFAQEQERSAKRGEYVAPHDAGQKLSAWAAEWEKHQDWKDTTRQSWPPIFGRIEAVLGDPPIGQIRKSDMMRLRTSLMEQYARSTATITLSMAVKLLRDAYEDRRITSNPGLGVRAPRARGSLQRIGPDDVPATAEVLRIWQAAPDRFRAAIALGAAGLRVGEVLGLSADRVLDGEVLVDRQLQRASSGERVLTTPKAEKERTVQLPSAVALELRRHLAEHQGSGMLFRGGRSNGEAIRRDAFYVQAWRPALVAAGFDRRRFKFHSLRHWCASSMIAEGIPVTAVAAHIGDTVETLLAVYAHWLREADTVPVDVLDRLLAPDSVPIISPSNSLKLVDGGASQP